MITVVPACAVSSIYSRGERTLCLLKLETTVKKDGGRYWRCGAVLWWCAGPNSDNRELPLVQILGTILLSTAKAAPVMTLERGYGTQKR